MNDFRLANPGPVVVTGSAGRLGRAVTARLLGLGVQIRAFDRNPTPGVDPRGGSSLLDSAALDRVMAGAGTLIHLAASPQDEDFDSELVPNNILGLERVMRSAARAGVRRWILASSIQVNLRQSREGPWPVRVTDPISPLRWYAATKVLLESAGYSHARDHGIEVLAVRLGWCPRDAGQVREIEEEPIAQDTFLSPGDTGRFFAAAVSGAMEPGFRVVFATSRPVREWVFDPEPARTLLGWEPLDVWPMDALECRS